MNIQIPITYTSKNHKRFPFGYSFLLVKEGKILINEAQFKSINKKLKKVGVVNPAPLHYIIKCMTFDGLKKGYYGVDWLAKCTHILGTEFIDNCHDSGTFNENNVEFTYKEFDNELNQMLGITGNEKTFIGFIDWLLS